MKPESAELHDNIGITKSVPQSQCIHDLWTLFLALYSNFLAITSDAYPFTHPSDLISCSILDIAGLTGLT